MFIFIVVSGNVVECEPTAITWTDGTGAYAFNLRGSLNNPDDLCSSFLLEV